MTLTNMLFKLLFPFKWEQLKTLRNELYKLKYETPLFEIEVSRKHRELGRQMEKDALFNKPTIMGGLDAWD